ncbi:MAG: TolC family protein [Vicinamibacterales bacterium]
MVMCGLGLTVALSLLQPSQPAAPAPTPPVPLTLQEVLQRVDTVASVRAARARADGTQSAAAQTPRWANPSIELRPENWGSGVGLSLDVYATVTQRLEVFGTRSARFGLANAEALDAEQYVAVARTEAARTAARLYLDAVSARDHLAIVREQREGLEDIVSALSRRVAEGVTAEADLRKFETERAQVQAVVLRLEFALARRLRELAAFVGLPGVAANQLMLPIVSSMTSPDEMALEASIERRADVSAARTLLARAESTLSLASAHARPDLTVTGGYKRNSGYNTGVIAVVLPVPLFDRNGAAVARARGEVRADALELDAVRVRARAEALSWINELQALVAHNAQTVESLLEPARTARVAARAAFLEGSFDPLRLVDAERAWTEARRTRLALEVEAVLASIETRAALGLEIVP